jgi:U2-associated protein SR140
VFTQDVSEFLRGLLDGTIKLEAKEEKAAKEAAETVVSMTEEKCEDSAKFKTSGFKSSFKPLEPLKAPPITEDVDGEAMEEDKEDLDGEAIDDLDGEAMDEDLDGETM